MNARKLVESMDTIAMEIWNVWTRLDPTNARVWQVTPSQMTTKRVQVPVMGPWQFQIHGLWFFFYVCAFYGVKVWDDK